MHNAFAKCMLNKTKLGVSTYLLEPPMTPKNRRWLSSMLERNQKCTEFHCALKVSNKCKMHYALCIMQYAFCIMQ